MAIVIALATYFMTRIKKILIISTLQRYLIFSPLNFNR